MGNFLVKHYFDVVGEAGEWAIAYEMAAAGMRYRELKGTGVAGSCWDLRMQAANAPAGTEYTFGACCARWDGGGIENGPCFESDVLRWRLTRLRCDASVHTPGAVFRGLGYGETVTLKRAPWHIGVEELWWGRFVSPQTFLTCIVADGARPIRFGVHDGASTADVEIARPHVRIGEAHLELLEREQEIAEGDVFGCRARLVQRVCRMLGASGLEIHQDKAVFRCKVTTPRGEESGFVIAEHVILRRLFRGEAREAQA